MLCVSVLHILTNLFHTILFMTCLLFYPYRNWGTENLNNLPMIIQLLSSSARIQTQVILT